MSSIPFWFKTTFALGQETGAIKVGTLKHTLPIYLVFFALRVLSVRSVLIFNTR